MTNNTDTPLAQAFSATGLKQREIAAKLRTSEAQVSRWRRGQMPHHFYRESIVRLLKRHDIDRTIEELWPNA